MGGQSSYEQRFIVTSPNASTLAVGIRTSGFSNVGGGLPPALEVRGAVKFYGGGLKVGGQPHNSQILERSIIDFSDAVTTTDVSTSLATGAYMIVPRLTTAQRNALRDGISNSATLMTGSMVYDTDLNKLCVYDNGGWKGVTLGSL